MASEGSDKSALDAVPELDCLVKGGTDNPASIRRELNLQPTISNRPCVEDLSWKAAVVSCLL